VLVWGHEKEPRMKGKRYTTEDKIHILREADGGKAILEVCREHNISEVSFHRWKRQFGQLEMKEARRLKELTRENGELKKMLAEALLKNRVLEAVCENNCKPGASTGVGADDRGGWGMLGARSVPYPEVVAVDVLVSRPTTLDRSGTIGEAVAGIVRILSAVRLSADRGVVASGGLAGGHNGRYSGCVEPRVCECRRPSARSCGTASRPGSPSRRPIAGTSGPRTSLPMQQCGAARCGS